MLISIIIPTYNPHLNRLQQTLNGLKNQTLDKQQWELIIVDNNSTNNFTSQIDIAWHPNHLLVAEQRQGLTYARLKGFENSQAELMIMVDDDNILEVNYLQNVINIFNNYPNLGAAGGKSIPIFEANPPAWLNQFYGSLALRNMGEEVLIDNWQNKYPPHAPIGAGMAIRKTALLSYLQKVKNGNTVASDRTGSSLASGGDNEIVLDIVSSDWQVGYFPELSLHHIIPPARTQKTYLARLEKQTNRSWVQLLNRYQICPWKKIAPISSPLRKLKAYFTFAAWRNETNYIRWQGACGLFEGLATL